MSRSVLYPWASFPPFVSNEQSYDTASILLEAVTASILLEAVLTQQMQGRSATPFQITH